jgi:hypothetical protein
MRTLLGRVVLELTFQRGLLQGRLLGTLPLGLPPHGAEDDVRLQAEECVPNTDGQTAACRHKRGVVPFLTGGDAQERSCGGSQGVARESLTYLGQLVVELGQGSVDQLGVAKRRRQSPLHGLAAADESINVLYPAEVHASTHPGPV